MENTIRISTFFERMAVPKRKTSKSKRNMRRSHHAIAAANVVVNKETGEYQRQHCMTQGGLYKGVQVTKKDN